MVFTVVDILTFVINAIAFVIASFSIYALISESRYWSGGLKSTLLYLSFASMCFLTAGVVMNILQYFFPSEHPTLLILPQTLYLAGFVFAFISIYELKKFSSFFVRSK
jgi:hypothetical protein